MIRKEYYQNPKHLRDLKDFDSSGSELAIFANAKNIDRLKDLNITKLWLIGGKDTELEKIFSMVKPTFINIYQVLTADLSVLETLTNVETILLRWGTKTRTLWNIAYNKDLKSLTIDDFSKINSIDNIREAANLEYLVLSGGMWTPLKLDNLNPLSDLKNLQFLALLNMHVKEGGLLPIANLTNLKELDISNQFETKDYAYLAAHLRTTECERFNPFIKYDKPIGRNDTMITGKRKPFLNSETDRAKIEKYSSEFYKMIRALSIKS